MLTTYKDPAQIPDQTMEQAVFDALWASFLADMPKFVAEWNAEIAAFNAALGAFNGAAAGGAYAMAYRVDLSATADADPGAGKLRFNNAIQSLATVLRLDVIGLDTSDYTKSLDTLDASTSTVKGSIRIVKLGDARKFLTYNVTARATPAGYRNITVVPVDFSSANPFVNDDQVLVFFQSSGDKGDKGDKGNDGTLLVPTIHVRDERASGTGGGSFPSNQTWLTRALLAVKLNTITGASLASNRVTLPAGTYEFEGSVSAWSVANHQARLYNVTDSAVAVLGTTEHASALTNGSQLYASSRSFLRGRFTTAASKTFELQHFVQSGAHYQAAGQPANTGDVEVYSEVVFRKVA